MKVRVFPGASNDPIDRATCQGGTDHSFPMLPGVGHTLFFTDEPGGEYVVAKVGFVQDGPTFIAAIWLDGPVKKSGSHLKRSKKGGGQESVPDLNSDIPPASMEGY